MQIQIHENMTLLQDRKAEWNNLVLNSFFPNIFQTWEWAETWWEHFGKDRQLCIITAMDDSGQLLGILPIWVGMISSFTGVEFPLVGSIEDKGPVIACVRQPGIGLIGDGSPVFPEYLGFIIRKDGVERVIELMLDSLVSFSENWRIMRFSDLLIDSVCTRAFITNLKRRYTVELSEGEKCYYQTLPESYNDFMAQLSRKRRKTIRQTLKWAQKSFDVRLEVITNPDDVEKGLKIIKNIYQKSERGVNNIGGWRLADYRAFHREVAHAFAKNGWLRIYILWFDDTPVAFLYCYFFSGILSAYQTGFNFAYKKHGPGSIILQKGIEDCIKQGAKEFDYLRGEEGYKHHFAKNMRQQIKITVFRKSGPSLWGFQAIQYIRKYLRNG